MRRSGYRGRKRIENEGRKGGKKRGRREGEERDKEVMVDVGRTKEGEDGGRKL